MGKSNHGEYLTRIDTGPNENVCLFRPQNHPVTKYDCLVFKRHDYTTKTVELVSQQIKTNLVPNLISRDVIKKYKKGHPRWSKPYFGYCVPATFAMLFLMRTDRLEPMSGTDSGGVNHWWLRDMDTQEFIDPTSEQFSKKEREIVYKSGKPKRLYSFQGKPQKRMLDLIEMMQPEICRRYVEFPHPKPVFKF